MIGHVVRKWQTIKDHLYEVRISTRLDYEAGNTRGTTKTRKLRGFTPFPFLTPGVYQSGHRQELKWSCPLLKMDMSILVWAFYETRGLSAFHPLGDPGGAKTWWQNSVLAFLSFLCNLIIFRFPKDLIHLDFHQSTCIGGPRRGPEYFNSLSRPTFGLLLQIWVFQSIYFNDLDFVFLLLLTQVVI